MLSLEHCTKRVFIQCGEADVFTCDSMTPRHKTRPLRHAFSIMFMSQLLRFRFLLNVYITGRGFEMSSPVASFSCGIMFQKFNLGPIPSYIHPAHLLGDTVLCNEGMIRDSSPPICLCAYPRNEKNEFCFTDKIT
jgi:hypothetical protein